MAQEKVFGISVSLKLENINHVKGYMSRTKQNFSQTLNRIIEEWDKFSILAMKLAEQQKEKNRKDLEKQTKEYWNDLKQAKVVK